MTPAELKKYRVQLKLTQKQIAKELEVSHRFWQYREHGERSIPVWLARAVNDLIKNSNRNP